MHPLAFRVDQPLRKSAIALVMAAVMMLSGCWFKASWIATAEKDLPVLIQMAESIASIVSVVRSAQPASPDEIANIQHISDVATGGLKAIDALYQSYKSANSTTVIGDIQAAGAALTQNLQQLLAAGQIKDPARSAAVTAAVSLIISTMDVFLSLLPNAPASLKVKYGGVSPKPPQPSELRKMWAEQVHTPLVAR